VVLIILLASDFWYFSNFAKFIGILLISQMSGVFFKFSLKFIIILIPAGKTPFMFEKFPINVCHYDFNHAPKWNAEFPKSKRMVSYDALKYITICIDDGVRRSITTSPLIATTKLWSVSSMRKSDFKRYTAILDCLCGHYI
jgi:hypothetical protein